ncbi:acyl-CoA dehydrogenase, partial [bacterium]|nr:acyl-CoA dehydrogenase [bacterium]
IEDKLGIHGSPTCELQFNNVPATLVGRRRFGLVRYIMSLMNGARLAIAAQSVGISEAAYRAALDYAKEREQFGKAILHFPSVAELLVTMRLKVELSRLLTIDCAAAVDFEKEYEKRANDPATKAEFRPRHRLWTSYASALTPMAKYYAADASVEVSNMALAVLGGSGYMRDYPVERYVRDARITNIYEGTSQLQVVAILASILGGGIQPRLDELAARDYTGATARHLPAVQAAHARFNEAVDYCKERGERDYTDLVGRHLADLCVDVYCGYRLLDHGAVNADKATLTDLFIPQMTRRVAAATAAVLSGDRTLLDTYQSLLGID